MESQHVDDQREANMSNYTSAKVGKKNIVVAGAGQIGTPLVQRLHAEGHAVTWLSRTRPSVVPEGVTHLCVDARDASAVAEAAQGKDALIAAVNPATYDAKVWAEALPPLHEGLIEGAGRAGTRLVVLDALYLYATDEGPLSPRTKQAPATEKGKIRKALADMLMDAHAKGRVRATTLRAPDFWGPGLSSAVLTEDALAGMRKGTGPLLVGNPDVPHAFAHRDDVVEGLIALAFAEEDVLGRAYHVPVIHPTPRALMAAFGEAFGVKVKPRVAPKWLLRVAGLFSASTRGLVEMLPQWDAPYLVDDSDYRARFGTAAITLEEGVARIAQAV
jgi:nucleoside-diphosphate-sugar epimerase